MNKKIFAVLLFSFGVFFNGICFSQTSVPLYLVTLPTAGTIPWRTYNTGVQLFDGGGVVNTLNVGISELFNVGISFGGANIIGSSRAVWQPHIGFNAKVRIVEESMKSPAIAIGFDSQGDGPFIPKDGYRRFRIKSRGAYLLLSRNYNLLGTMGLHGGMSYSLEHSDKDYDATFWAGVDKSIGSIFNFCAEYDTAQNDNENDDIDKRSGYLNGALKITLNSSFTIEFDLKNILRDDILTQGGLLIKDPQPSREIRFYYTGTF